MNSLAIIGNGRLGRSLSRALRATGRTVLGPLGRHADVEDADVVLLCVPDGEIAAASAAVPARAGRLVGHVSGATTLEPLAGHEAFSLHPLMTFVGPVDRDAPGPGAPDDVFAGASAAVAGATDRALDAASELAAALGMRTFAVADGDRAAYHAAASIASNYLVTLEAAAERLLGHDRELLVPLVRATVENWAALGPEGALTGPIARGDEATVERQRAAIAEREPALLALFDTLADATRELAARKVAA
jgi:predicted short-subunit dehydrogenase-like oxidoreductase (DUF2520 family)